MISFEKSCYINPVEPEYNIFECLPDGAVSWCDTAYGLVNARLKLQEIAKTATNDHFAIRLPTHEVVFRISGSPKALLPIKRVFQIAYTEELRKKRADVLRSRGYGVLSVIGNEPAKTLLSTSGMPCDEIAFFLIGHAAPDPARKEMVDWLKALCPHVKIIALNPPGHAIPTADYNVLQNGPEAWLPILASATS